MNNSLFSPIKELPNTLSKIYIAHSTSTKFVYNIMKMCNNKITVINEVNKIPNNCRIGILIPRNELMNKQCQAISLLYKENGELYKQFQLKGGETNMTFDDDLLYWNGSCLEENECIKLLPKMIHGIYKLKERTDKMNKLLEYKMNIHNWLNQINGDNECLKEREEITKVIYNKKDENIPLNIDNIKKSIHLSTQHIIVTSGISQTKMKQLSSTIQAILSPYISKSVIKTTPLIPKYKPFERRSYITGDCYTNIKLFFPSFPWSSPNTPSFNLINEIFGAATPFSAGGPGKGIFARSYEKILKKKGYIASCRTLTFPSKYHGLFGFDFTCFMNEKETLSDIIDTIHQMKKDLSHLELQRAKNILIRKILFNLGNNASRVEDAAKSYYYFNRVIGENYVDMIEKVTIDDIYKSINHLISHKDKAILFIQGNKNKIDKIPKLKEALKLL